MIAVSIIIPTSNGRQRLTRLFPTIHGQRSQPAEVLVVDNASDDGSGDYAESQGARVIRFRQNLGFAKAVNTGIDAARQPAVWILNDDLMLDPTCLQHLSDALNDPRIWFAAPRLLDARSPWQIDGSFDAVCRGGTAWRCGQGRIDGPQWSIPCDIDVAPMTAALFRRSLFERIGLLDERLGSYLEDVDFGMRCASNGYRGRYTPSAIAYHEGSATLGTWNPAIVRNIARNQVFLIAKHYYGNVLLRNGWRIAVAQLLWGGVAIRHGVWTAWLRGKWDGIRLYRQFRGTPTPPAFEAFLERSEQVIYDFQQRTGWDPYWRLYFSLTFGYGRNRGHNA